MMGRKILLLGLALAGGMILPAAARADLKFCNKTDKKIWVAIGYHEKSKADWVSHGWWTVAPGACQTTISDALSGQYYYWYAEDEGDGVWSGNFVFCTTEKKFQIEGRENCKSRGYDAQGFRELKAGEDINKTVDLTSQ